MAGQSWQSWAREAGVGKGKVVPDRMGAGQCLAGTRAVGMAGRSWTREAGVDKGKAVPSRMGAGQGLAGTNKDGRHGWAKLGEGGRGWQRQSFVR